MTNPFRKSVPTFDNSSTSPSTNEQTTHDITPHYELYETRPSSDADHYTQPSSNAFAAPHPLTTYSSWEQLTAGSRKDISPLDVSINDDKIQANNTKPNASAIVSQELAKYKASQDTTTPAPPSNKSNFKLVATTQIHKLPTHDTVWPSREDLEKQAKANKRARRKAWNCLGGLPKKQRLCIKILIALVLIAAAVGIGVGISRAVGGTTYSTRAGYTKPIDGSGPSS